ncbi:hypothetical protein [Salirhabdus salicampi]|uniref:hypothetical protein n=1 Tax=Salirhabdus salicampi TaxID=476102 RepID=UPI0020C2045F|nr:hypothetical protein [Salirhabdus salicampi]MCP8617383.1 hypothetical protein [Salirhabdus salicampi]
MRHTSERFFQFQHIALGVCLVCSLIGLFSKYSAFYLLALYALAISFAFEGLGHYLRFHQPYFILQIIRAIIILVISTIIFFS